jgi:hypothetical protein
MMGVMSLPHELTPTPVSFCSNILGQQSLRAALLGLSQPTSDPTAPRAWCSLGEPSSMVFATALDWIKAKVGMEGGNWWDLFNPPNVAFVPRPRPVPRSPSPEPPQSPQQDISSPQSPQQEITSPQSPQQEINSTEGELTLPLPQNVGNAPNSSVQVSLSATITTNSRLSVVSFTIPTSAIGLGASPTPNAAWPFGNIKCISGIVSAVEEGVSGVKLGDWRAPNNSLAVKKCNYLTMYAFFKSSAIKEDIATWEEAFENEDRPGRILPLSRILGIVRRLV